MLRPTSSVSTSSPRRHRAFPRACVRGPGRSGGFMRRDVEPCMPSVAGTQNPDSAEQYAARAEALRAIVQAGAPIVVAGAYAMREYAGIIRDTKDLDVFCRRTDVEHVLAALASAGFRTEITDPVWLAKGFHRCGEFVDVIFSSGNGVADVDDHWFAFARPTEVLGVPTLVAPPEEIIWS